MVSGPPGNALVSSSFTFLSVAGCFVRQNVAWKLEGARGMPSELRLRSEAILVNRTITHGLAAS